MWRIGYGEGYYGSAKYGVPSVTYVSIAAASSSSLTSAGSPVLVREASAVAACVFSVAVAATLVREVDAASALSVSTAITDSTVSKTIGLGPSLLVVTSAANVNLVRPLSAGADSAVVAAMDAQLIHGAAASLDLVSAADCWVSLVAVVAGAAHQNVDSNAAAFYKWEPLIPANYHWQPAETHGPPAWGSLPVAATSWAAVGAPDPQPLGLVPTAPSV